MVLIAVGLLRRRRPGLGPLTQSEVPIFGGGGTLWHLLIPEKSAVVVKLR